MGGFLEICPCQDEDNSKYENNKVSFRETISTVPDNNNDTTDFQIPLNVVDLKISKKDLIRKRTESPLDFYEKICDLGHGSYGNVIKVMHKTSKSIRAMKIIPKEAIASGVDSNEILNEINILRKLDHPYIMKIFEFFEDDENFYIINELCDQGDLAETMDTFGKFPEFIVKYFMKQVFQAVSYLHSEKVIHGDIKRENILLYSVIDSEKNLNIRKSITNFNKNSSIQKELGLKRKVYSSKTKEFLKDLSKFEIKLADFGCAKIFNKQKLSGIIGTTYYCSPEVLKNKYKDECDEWSCGILMYILLAGEPPFQGDSEEEIMKNIINQKLNLDVPELENVSKQCKDLIKKLLEKDPDKRLTATGALAHNFFKDTIDVDKILNDENDDSVNTKGLRGSLSRRRRSKFQDAVYAYIALNFTDKEEENKIKRLFQKLSGGEGSFKIDAKTFVNNLTSYDKNINPIEAMQIFQEIDSDKNGTIEYQELIRAVGNREKLLTEKNLRESFEFFDVDKSGTITWDEINRVVFGGKEVGKDLMFQFLAEIGKKEGDQITFEEFCEIMKN